MTPSGDAGARARAPSIATTSRRTTRASLRVSFSLASVVLVAVASLVCLGSYRCVDAQPASALDAAAAREDPAEVMGSDLRGKVATRRLLFLNSNSNRPSNNSRPGFGFPQVVEGVMGVFDQLPTLPTPPRPPSRPPPKPQPQPNYGDCSCKESCTVIQGTNLCYVKGRTSCSWATESYLRPGEAWIPCPSGGPPPRPEPQPEPQNCEGYWSEWGESDNSRKCRRYEIKTPALRGGSECEHEQGEEECENPPIITSRVKVDLDFAEYEQRPVYYQNLFKDEVAATLGIDEERVVIVNVYEGSVIFEFYIKNDPDLLAAQSLQAKIGEKGRVCVAPTPILDVTICKDDACEDEAEDGGEDRPITTRVKVDLDFAEYRQRSVSYNNLFKEEVATTLGINKERVLIVNVYDNESTIFESYLTNDSDLAVAESLQTKMEEKGKMCLGYSAVEDVRICKDDICKDPITTRVKVDLDFAEYQQRPESYENLFKDEVADALTIERERFVIVDVYEDESTIFESYMTNDPDLVLAESLQAKVENGTMTMSFARAIQALICKEDACEKDWGDPIQLIREG